MNREYCVHLHSHAYLSEFKDENGLVFEIIDSQDRAIYLTPDQYAALVRYHPLYKELVERVKTEVQRNAANGDARMKAEQAARDNERLRLAENVCKVLAEYRRNGEFFDPETTKWLDEWIRAYPGSP